MAGVSDTVNPEKSYMQGLAVETMLLADGCLSLLAEAKLVEAIPWLIAAHQRTIDCTCQAHQILNPSLADVLDICADAANEPIGREAQPRHCRPTEGHTGHYFGVACNAS